MTRALLPLAALALSAAACAEIEPLETTGVHEVFTGSSQRQWCERGDDARVLEQGADLVGPHFSVSMLCHYAETSVPEHVGEASESLAGLPQLIGGTELVINQFAFAPTYDPESEAGPVAAWIEAGDQRIELDSLPISGGYLAVSVPSGEDVALWVEDEGRAQGLDFRTGARIDPVAGYYDGLDTEAVEVDGFAYEEISILNGSDAYRVTCSSAWGEVTRSVWLPDHGWAEDGAVFVTVELRWCDDFEDVLRWELDGESALTAETGEEPLAPVDWAQRDADDGRIGIEAVFAVPADTADLVIGFTPVGDLKNLSGGQDFAFAETPETTEWAVSF